MNSNTIRLFFLISLFLSCTLVGTGQEFLIPEKENDLARESKFIEAQSEIIIGNTEGAIKIYESLLKKDVNDDEAAFFLGKLYLDKGDLANGIKYFSLALSNEKNNPWYYIWSADAYIKNKQFDEATQTIEKLVQQFPEERSYYERLEYLYRDSKQYAKQIELIDRMLERFGFHKNDALEKVQALENNHQPKKALDLLSDLSNRFPRDLFILNLLANYYERYDKDELALETYKKIIAINPNDSRANLALVEAQNGDNISGTQRLLGMKSFFLNGNIDFDTQFSEVLPFIQQNLASLPHEDLNALEQISEWLLESHPDDPKALSLRADILVQAGKNVEAVEYYLQTVKIYPDNYMVWEQLLWSFKELHRWKELNQYADDAALYFPNKSVLYLLKGESEFHLKDWDNAQFDLETCLSLASEDPVMKSNALGMLALISCAVKSMNNDKYTFEQAREVLEGNPNLDYFESQCNILTGNHQQALTNINSALIKVPGKPSYAVQKAKILYELGKFQESLRILLPLDGNTTYFPVYTWIAENYKKLNQVENAEKYSLLGQQYGGPSNKPAKN